MRWNWFTSSTSSWSPAGSIVGASYHKLQRQSSVPEDGRNYRPKHAELIEIINTIIIVASRWLFMLFFLKHLIHSSGQEVSGF